MTWATASGAANGDVSFAHCCRASSSGVVGSSIQLRARRGDGRYDLRTPGMLTRVAEHLETESKLELKLTS